MLFLKPGCFSLRVVKLHVIFLLISEHVCVFPELRHCLKGKQDDCYEDYNFYGSIHRARRKHGLNYRINPGEFNVVILSSVLTQLLQVNLLLYLYSRKTKTTQVWIIFTKRWNCVLCDKACLEAWYLWLKIQLCFLPSTCSLFPTNRHVLYFQQIDMFFISNKQTCALFPTNRYVLYFQQTDMFFISNK